MNIPLPDGNLIDLDRPLIMGVLNVTPDSFSDGGAHDRPEAAIARARAMVEAGADLIDIGGESTRPGAEPVSAEQQCRRVLPVIEQLSELLSRGEPGAGGVHISIDTSDADVAGAAMDAGAAIVNDVTAGRGDGRMLPLAATRGWPVILMHMQGTPRTMQDEPRYGDVVAEVRSFLIERCDAAVAAGIAPSRLVLDPGIGFGKTYDHNMALLAGLEKFTSLDQPILVGVSRKRALGRACQLAEQERLGRAVEALRPDQLDGATAGVTAMAVAAGVRILRVHEVGINRQAADTAWQICKAAGSLPWRVTGCL